MNILPRGLEPALRAAWRSAPVVVLEGLRATGKTTLAKALVPADRYHSFTDPQVLERAKSDPRGWLESLPVGSVIDEAQLLPGITLAVKVLIDERAGAPGQILFTGSSKVSRSELGGSDALAGRARWLRVEAFAQSEIEGAPRDAVSALFDEDPRSWSVDPVRHSDLTKRFVPGGLPTIRGVDPPERSIRLAQYAEALFGKVNFPTAKSRDGILRLFRHLCATSSHFEVFERIQASLQLDKRTIQGYLDALMSVFLVEAVEGYRSNPGKRITEKRRLFVSDPAFVAGALGLTTETVALFNEHGAFTETVVAIELRRLMGWSALQPLELRHWRMNDKNEVDLVVERPDGRVLAIEVKTARQLSGADDQGIRAFRRENPDSFHRGFVMHAGDHVAELAPDVWAVPFSVLWQVGDRTDATATLHLSERLMRARERIELHTRTTSDESVQRAAAIEISLRNADRRFRDVQHLFDPVVEALRSLGLQAEVGEIETGANPSDGVLWFALRRMTLTQGPGSHELRLRARVVEPDVDRIEWVVAFGPLDEATFGQEFGGLFSTFWTEDPEPAVAERFGAFADALPEIYRELTAPEA